MAKLLTFGPIRDRGSQIILASSVTAALFLASSPCMAYVAFSSIPNLDVGPVVSDIGLGAPAHHDILYDEFTLGQDATFGTITFAVTSDYGASAPPDPFQQIGFDISSDAGGVPGSTLFGEATGVGASGFSYSETAFGTTLVTAPFMSNVTLAAGTYWMGFGSSAPLEMPAYDGGSGKALIPLADTTTYSPTGLSAGFELGAFSPDPTPEPSTWALMLVGFGAAGASLRGARRPMAG